MLPMLDVIKSKNGPFKGPKTYIIKQKQDRLCISINDSIDNLTSIYLFQHNALEKRGHFDNNIIVLCL